MEFKRYFYTNYYVAKDGTVKSIRKGIEKIVKPKLTNKGYLYIKIDGKLVSHHRMVMICWQPRIDYIFMMVNHKDGNKENNHFDNLEWCTAKENSQHYHKHLRPKK